MSGFRYTMSQTRALSPRNQQTEEVDASQESSPQSSEEARSQKSSSQSSEEARCKKTGGQEDRCKEACGQEDCCEEDRKEKVVCFRSRNGEHRPENREGSPFFFYPVWSRRIKSPRSASTNDRPCKRLVSGRRPRRAGSVESRRLQLESSQNRRITATEPPVAYSHCQISVRIRSSFRCGSGILPRCRSRRDASPTECM